MKGIKGFPKGPDHFLWKGEKVKYGSLHAWVQRTLGNPRICQDCGCRNGNYHWANISGKYKRDPKDWKRLCVPCHNKFDGRIGNGHASTKFSISDKIRMISLYSEGSKPKDIREMFKISKSHLRRIIKNSHEVVV